ncbi:hypothetical protein ACYRFF_00255 [Listeria welshimeri]|uniref:DUF3953 domain-containing protein n=1 Tax=Listeria welshimeri TaxID=1643 RepID=A0ABX4ICY2_LISWE|nr:hypothetical protein [Listeria welshimeri]MBC1353936.1 hypothetical protein [Listeria welshimeri]MBC1467387.1 hypothetical protein [Listeria welshimeri]MBC1468729.1 hypothetical protein [Listeria welshimeri]MBC1638601.1 hypothetical protein [Listeria welshimeri]MBC1670738.1 hypothetical protein [Listeria welshimeri]
MKKIIKIILIASFILFLFNNMWTMFKTKEGIDSPLWIQFALLISYLASAIVTYKSKWFGFFSIFVVGVLLMLVSILVSF